MIPANVRRQTGGRYNASARKLSALTEGVRAGFAASGVPVAGHSHGYVRPFP
jgi:hypothetical protein